MAPGVDKMLLGRARAGVAAQRGDEACALGIIAPSLGLENDKRAVGLFGGCGFGGAVGIGAVAPDVRQHDEADGEREQPGAEPRQPPGRIARFVGDFGNLRCFGVTHSAGEGGRPARGFQGGKHCAGRTPCAAAARFQGFPGPGSARGERENDRAPASAKERQHFVVHVAVGAHDRGGVDGVDPARVGEAPARLADEHGRGRHVVGLDGGVDHGVGLTAQDGGVAREVADAALRVALARELGEQVFAALGRELLEAAVRHHRVFELGHARPLA